MFKPRFWYCLALYLIAPLLPLRLLWRARKQAAYVLHWRERFALYAARDAGTAQMIWIHAVSVGETRAAAPLIDALQLRHPTLRILLTHMTPTGRETGKALFGARVTQAYLPYDFPGAARRFVQRFRPCLGLLMETEIWPNLIAACQMHAVPIALINARMSARSARRYAWAPRLTREALRQLSLVCAQTNADGQRLAALGACAIAITGNMKFDVSPAPSGTELRAVWNTTRPIVLAASTRDGEETLILDAYLAYATAFLLVMVPRHPQRFETVARLIEHSGVQWQRRSAGLALKDSQVILGDSMGEMADYYGAADLAIIGGSLLPYGGQNLIEACALGVPVLLGPHTENFAQVAEDAIAAGAALRVQDAASALAQAQVLIADPAKRLRMAAAGRTFAAAHKGAVCKTLVEIETKLLEPSHDVKS